MKKLLRKLVPEKLILGYHAGRSYATAFKYGFPAKGMIIIGVTGTKGKTSATNYIWSVLSAAGYKTGIISTANIRIGDEQLLNKYHMTMPGRSAIQDLLKQMGKAGCEICLVETTSEGLKQYRHVGISYDCAVFTNLTPEHLPSHGGSFEKYKQAKGILFASLSHSPPKKLRGEIFPKTIVANSDSEHADYYLSFKAERKVTFGITKQADIRGTDLKSTGSGVAFKVGEEAYETTIPGTFNVYNALPAIAIAKLLKATPAQIAKGLNELTVIPGRMERIEEAKDFAVFVDYAHEGASVAGALEAGRLLAGAKGKVIFLLGAEGGGRDTKKRPVMGKLSAEQADYTIVSNVDSYDDDPLPIVEDIAVAAEKAGAVRNKNLFAIPDRREGIRKALQLAGKGDVVLITGKGAEQTMILSGVTEKWDDRTVVREELKKLTQP
ncbi:UDP-N-acetylmuramoyl-L-alanyl-D-glutamate--2,6-diaminopimelate ligase [soil metagenome]